MMKKNLRKVVLLALASVMALSLTVCKGGSGSETTTVVQAESKEAESKETESGSEDVAIKLCWWGGDSRHEVIERVVDVFTAKYPNIKVECEHGAWTGQEEKQSLAIQGGNAADVMQINWNWIISYSGNGTNFANLEDYGDVLDLTQSSQDNLDQREADGKLMAVPVALTGRLSYRNKTTLDEVGCEIPTDEVSLLEAGAKFKAYNEDYYPLVMMEYDGAILLVYYLESVYGKPRVENGELQYTAEEIQANMDSMIKLEEAHMIPTITILQGDMVDSLDKNVKVIDGKCAGVSEWDSAASKAQKAVTENTTKSGQELVIGDFLKSGDYDGGFTKISMALVVSANSAHPKEAAMLINYLLNDDEAIEICGAERSIPCSAGGVKILEEKGIGDKLVMEVNAKVLTHSKFPLDPMFEHSDLKASPDGIYYKVFGKLSAGDTVSAQVAEDLMKGTDDYYNFRLSDRIQDGY